MSGKKTWAIATGIMLTLGVIAALGLLGWSVAMAAQTPPATGAKVVTAAGKITAVNKDGFTLETRQGLVNVTVNAQTWIVLGARDNNAGPTGLLEATAADLKADMGVNVAGTSPAAGQIVARLVKAGPGDLGFGPPPGTARSAWQARSRAAQWPAACRQTRRPARHHRHDLGRQPHPDARRRPHRPDRHECRHHRAEKRLRHRGRPQGGR